MIRPELAAAFRRFSEALWAVGIMACGLWLFTRGGWLFQALGLFLGLVGAALFVIGLRRARFRSGGGGPGIVQLDEGRIHYFGPFYGGSVSLAEVSRVELGPLKDGALVWFLHSQGQPALLVPLEAEGAEAMLDAFAVLPGLDLGQVISAMKTPPDVPVALWARSDGLVPRLRS